MSAKIAVVGGGTWGATLADVLARNGHDVAVWEFWAEAVKSLRETRTLKTLPQLSLHPSVLVTQDMVEALKGREMVLSAVPSDHVRKTWRAVRESKAFPAGAWVLSATKGIENDTLKRMSEIVAEELPELRGVAALSGPSHAEEVARRVPTAVVAAGPEALASRAQSLLQSETFRVYASSDIAGVELGGALKNIYAIACGVCDGLALGDNTKAALMTRGLNEMARIGISSGAQGATFAGLSGLGDLIVTCTSLHSRNRSLGEKIGKGKTLAQALAEMTMVAEGVSACKSGRQLARRLGLELPIVSEIHACLFEDKPARDALRDLMARPVAGEMSQVFGLLEKGGEMNKLGLIQAVSRVVSTRTEAKAAVNEVFEAMRRALHDGDKVVVQGFGSFHVIMRKSKPARNPRTGEAVRIPPRRRVKFKMGKELAGRFAASSGPAAPGPVVDRPSDNR